LKASSLRILIKNKTTSTANKRHEETSSVSAAESLRLPHRKFQPTQKPNNFDVGLQDISEFVWKSNTAHKSPKPNREGRIAFAKRLLWAPRKLRSDREERDAEKKEKLLKEEERKSGSAEIVIRKKGLHDLGFARIIKILYQIWTLLISLTTSD